MTYPPLFFPLFYPSREQFPFLRGGPPLLELWGSSGVGKLLLKRKKTPSRNSRTRLDSRSQRNLIPLVEGPLVSLLFPGKLGRITSPLPPLSSDDGPSPLPGQVALSFPFFWSHVTLFKNLFFVSPTVEGSVFLSQSDESFFK